MALKRQNISQQRIAKDLGVSQALVSLVLNGKRENISEASYQRIWSHALRIGYTPKGMALNRNGASSTNVGFILRAGLRLHTQSNFFSHVQHGFHEGLLARGYHSVFLGAEDDLKTRSLQETLDRRQLAGLAVLGQVSRECMMAIKAVQANVVAVSISYPGLCQSVMPNERQALEQLVEHLVSLGHRNIAWVAGDAALDYNQRRHTALVEALEARGLKLSRRCVANVETGDRLAGWEAAELFMSRLPARNFPTACVCGNGPLARGFLSRLMQKGWRIPEQISVVAVDATRTCDEEHPRITGAHSDPEKIGTTAAELVARAAENPDGILSDVILPSQLTVRETSGKPPG